jgi:cytochrome c oxidase subunit 2
MDNSNGLWMPPAASTVAQQVDDLYFIIYWLCVVFFFLVAGGVVYFAWKYRRQRPDQLATAQIGHNTLLEATWTIIPGILVIWIFVLGFRVYMNLVVAPGDALEYQVTAKQWAWDFRDPDGCTTPGELHVPAGRPVKLLMRSNDVLHSFFVKDFRIKQDVVPGRYSQVWFQADKPGEHVVQCTEYCGTSHSNMFAKVIVHPPEAYAKKAETFCKVVVGKEHGEKLYKTQCAACHTLDGNRLVGPTFKGLWGREEKIVGMAPVLVDENYIVESIRVPTAKVVEGYPPAMPAFPTLTDDDIASIIEYMKTLK